MPYAANAAEYLYRVKIKKEDSYVHGKRPICSRGTIYFITQIINDAKKDIIKGLTVIELADDFTIKKN